MASKLQVSLDHFIQDDINTFYFVNGVLQKTYAVESNPGLLQYRLAERERGKSAAQLFSQALWKVSSHDLASPPGEPGSASILAVCLLATRRRQNTSWNSKIKQLYQR